MNTQAQTKAKTFKIRLLRNFFSKPGRKHMAGEVIEVEKDTAKRILDAGIGEKEDARSVD